MRGSENSLCFLPLPLLVFEKFRKSPSPGYTGIHSVLKKKMATGAILFGVGAAVIGFGGNAESFRPGLMV